jgi:High-temperature-induced dauer-formation protein
MGNSDSKTIFRDQVQILVNEEVPSEHFEFWDMLFSIPISLEDVYAMIPDADIQTLLDNRGSNFLKLYDYCVSILEDISLATEIPAAKIHVGSTATRILIRILPFALDSSEIMWSDQPRSIKTMMTALKLMFTTGYSVPDQSRIDIQEYNQLDMHRIWGHGLYKDNNYIVVPGNMWVIRYDLIKLLLTVSSAELYTTPSAFNTNLYLLYLTSKANSYLSQLTASLFNILLNFKPMGNWNLPYGSYFNYEFEEKSIKAALQLLSAFCYSSEKVQDPEILQKFGIGSEDINKNYFKENLANISAPKHLENIYKAFQSLISIVTISQNTYLPGSVKEIDFKEELVVFFWNFIKSNNNFKVFLENQENSYELCLPFIKLLESQSFIVTSSITYILLHLSTVRNFSSNLHHNFPNVLTDLPLFTGGYSDYIIIGLCKYIFSNANYYNALHSYFLMIISNISPYIRSMSPTTCQLLIRLIEKYSTKAWLFESEKNHYFLFYILEAINNIIQYQWQGSSYLVLSLIRKKDVLIKIFRISDQWEESRGNDWCNRDWFESWSKRLPLDVLKAILHYMIPKLEAYNSSNPKATDENILEYINKNTLVGLLPPPPGIVRRLLEVNIYSELYEHAHLWSFVFIKNLPHQIVPYQKIKLVKFGND